MRASRAALYAAAAALPVYPIRVTVGSMSLGLLEPLVVAAAVVFALEARITSVRPRWPGAFTGPMLALGAALALSLATAPDWRDPAFTVRTLFLEPVVLYAIACSALTGVEHLRRLASAMLVGGAGLAVANLILVGRAAVQGHAALVPPVAEVTVVDGFLLVPLAGLALALLLGGRPARRPSETVIPAAFLAVGLPAVLLSLGRDAWFCMVVVSVAVGCARLRRRWALCAVTAVVSTVLLAVSFRAQLPELVDPAATSNPGLPLWDQTAAVIADAVHGVPAGRQAGLTLGVEAGLLALGSLCWLAVRLARWYVTALPAVGDPARRFAVGAGVVILAVTVRGVIDPSMLSTDLAVLSLLAAAVLATVSRLERVRLRSWVRLPGMAPDIEPAELPMPADIPRRTGRYASDAHYFGDAEDRVERG